MSLFHEQEVNGEEFHFQIVSLIQKAKRCYEKIETRGGKNKGKKASKQHPHEPKYLPEHKSKTSKVLLFAEEIEFS